jgi:hypothetical protein
MDINLVNGGGALSSNIINERRRQVKESNVIKWD